MKYFLLLITSFAFAQQTQKVDFKTLEAHLYLDAKEKKVSGIVSYSFEVIEVIDTIKIDAQKMNFSSVSINQKEVKFKNSGKQLQLFEGFKKGKNTLTFEYKATPKQTLYFTGEGDNLQIWTQGQGKYTSHWLPSFDDVNEKLVFNLDIVFDKNYTVLSNGAFNSDEGTKEDQSGSISPPIYTLWSYYMKKPMSSYLVMLAIGKFDRQVLHSKTGIPIELYLKPEDKDKFASTYKYSAEIFDFFEKEIGVKYPWEIYRQIPVNDFLYAGMENTSATIFSQDYVVDEIGFNDRSYVNVNAHELAHQWFGDLITAESSTHHWLQEGFATYYALLAEKELFGEDHFNFELLKMAEELKEASKNDIIPVMNEKASSLTFYKKGAWALHVLDESIGHENFQKAVKNYLKKYQYKNVTTNDFLAEIKKVSHYDVENFKRVWLEKPGFETLQALAILSKNNAIKHYLEIQKLQSVPFMEKKEAFATILKSDVSYPGKQEILYQLAAVPFEDKKELIQLALQSNNVNVRQAVAETISTIPEEFKSAYESLLEDKSYYTRQIALRNLWKQFPADRAKYLDLSKDWVGLNNKNLKITWLTFALLTPDYHLENKNQWYAQLVRYTSADFDSSIRQNALESMLQVNPTDEQFLLSLISATIHYKWQFVKFGKDTLRELIKKDEFRKKITELLPKLSDREKIIVGNLLSEK